MRITIILFFLTSLGATAVPADATLFPTRDTGAVQRLLENSSSNSASNSASFLTPREEPAQLGTSTPSVWRSVGAALFVIGLLLAANRWVKRHGGKVTTEGKGGRLRIVDRIALDHRRGIFLVEADGERIIVATGADRIETLAVLPEKKSTRAPAE